MTPTPSQPSAVKPRAAAKNAAHSGGVASVIEANAIAIAATSTQTTASGNALLPAKRWSLSHPHESLPKIAATLPPELQISPASDQSIFVRAAVNGVLREATIAAGLTAALILLFLGSWRSTLVVAVSIPLSILTSLLILSLLGETINIMTLGGLALAVGILVDDATVEIENINRLMPEGMPLRETILTGAQQIAAPAFVATLSICIVFVPILFLKGVPGFLFRPLAEAVVFAMLASYFLSRTVVPTLVMYFFRVERIKADIADSGYSLPQVAMKFALAHPAMSTVIPGMRNVSQVEANIAASDLPDLPEPLLASLRKHIWLRGNWHTGK